MHAPNLTGLDSAYLIQQLRHFQAAVRGNESDTYGYMMIRRAGALPGDRGIRDVASYVASLPRKRSQPTISGDAQLGRKLYADACAACHGPNAEGNPSVGAPKLREQDPVYLRTQLEHFVSGVRGASPRDPGGVAMRAAVNSLQSPQATENVLAFIAAQ
jgi:cytochrome c553